MDYQKVRQRPRQFESVTGLKIEEFDFLYSSFGEQWKKFYRYHTLEGKKRKHPSTNPGKDTPSLPSIEEKLFFILVYLKNYSLQEMTAASFGFSQSNASKWVKILRPILVESLKKMGMLPEREGHKVKQMLERFGEEKCFQDVTERPINRPQDADTQREFYSGKKKSSNKKQCDYFAESTHSLFGTDS